MHLASIMRYPIKGFAGESLLQADLAPQQRMTGDRIYALQHRDRVPPQDIGWRPKKYFIQSVQTDILAEIDVHWSADHALFNCQGRSLSLSRPFDLDESLAAWVAQFFPDASGFEFIHEPTGLTDEPEAFISLVNQATVDAIAVSTATQANPARYRSNLVVDGLPPFAETDWIGAELHIGEVTFDVIEPIVRCLATECDWQGGRDKGFLTRLNESLNTDHCGVFLKTRVGGRLQTGDSLVIHHK